MTETIGWRYLFILVAGLAAITTVGGTLLYHETYAPVIRERIMQATKETGKTSESRSPHSQSQRNRLDYVLTNLKRPFMLLTRSIVCFALSSYMAW
jgi:predicted MFS family arabinose efflux permease